MKHPDNNQTWQQARLEGIADLYSLTEAAKELDTRAHAHHPGTNHYYYSTFINLIYKELFNLKKGTTRGIRNRLTTEQLKKLQMVERQTAQWIREALAANEEYHQVYYRVQEKVRTLMKSLGKEDLSEEKLW
jgi:hypothetical protein